MTDTRLRGVAILLIHANLRNVIIRKSHVNSASRNEAKGDGLTNAYEEANPYGHKGFGQIRIINCLGDVSFLLGYVNWLENICYSRRLGLYGALVYFFSANNGGLRLLLER